MIIYQCRFKGPDCHHIIKQFVASDPASLKAQTDRFCQVHGVRLQGTLEIGPADLRIEASP